MVVVDDVVTGSLRRPTRKRPVEDNVAREEEDGGKEERNTKVRRVGRRKSRREIQ